MTDVPPVALRTYRAIRLGVVGVIVALGYAVWREIATSPDDCVQRSLSAYYYTPVRPVFVGALLIIGFAMIVMWGKTWKEDAALNLAGLLLMVVALVPTLDANYCSIPKELRGKTPDTSTKQISDNKLIAENAETVGRSFTSLLVVLALILLFVAVVAVYRWQSQGIQPKGPDAIVWGLAALAWVVYVVLYQDHGNPDSAFNHEVHSYSANLAVGLIIVAVVLAARQKRTVLRDLVKAQRADSDEAATATKWQRLYGLLAGAMLVVIVVIKGGDLLHLFSGWVDAHATFLLEAILIALIGVFWVLQTIDRRSEGAPTY